MKKQDVNFEDKCQKAAMEAAMREIVKRRITTIMCHLQPQMLEILRKENGQKMIQKEKTNDQFKASNEKIALSR